MAGKKQNKSMGMLLALLVIGVVAGIYFFAMDNRNAPIPGSLERVENAADTTEEIEAAEIEEETVEIDTAAAIKDRILGDPNAPIKISEHSSFTCSHCGSFHKTTFDAFKARMIDTGKAYLVFSDFPLNAPALHASMVARCLPEDQYFNFVDDLFKSQEDWAFDAGYMGILQTKAETYGLSPKAFKACLDNKAIQEGILNRMRAAQAQWQISSTPSFVVNNKTTISGALPIDEFEKAIEEAAAPEPVEEAAEEVTEDAPTSEETTTE